MFGVTVTKARSLSVAMTGPQLTVADVCPSSAKTLRSDGQVSLKEGAWISKIKMKQEKFQFGFFNHGDLSLFRN